MSKKSPIPVDPYKPFVPQEVVDSIIADDVRYMYRRNKKPIPDSLTQFLDDNSEEDRGRDWEISLLKILVSGTIPLDIVEKWLVELTSSFIRAEFQAWFKQQKSVDNGTTHS